jgi:PAS domain S-box-containing protein
VIWIKNDIYYNKLNFAYAKLKFFAMADQRLPIPENEQGRLNALKHYGILDSISEKEFDRITELASIICNTPMSLISLIDENRQWFKSKIGIDLNETPRGIAFCQYTIMQDAILEVEDAQLDDRFKDNELVTGGPGIRFYAGVPLRDPSGYNLGTICVLDHKARNLTETQKRALTLLSEEVTGLIIERRQKEELRNFESLFKLSPDLICIANVDGYITKANPRLQHLLGITAEKLVGTSFYQYIHPDDLQATKQETARLGSGEKVHTFTMRIRSVKGDYRSVQWTASPEKGTNHLFAVGRDLTEAYELEKNLLSTKKILEETNSVARIGSWQVDLASQKLYWTAVTREIHGMPADFEPDLQAGINFYKAGESREEITKAVTKAMEGGGSWDLELQIVNAQHKDVWVRAIGKAEMKDGVCHRLYGTFQDIDEKKKAQIEAHESRAILSAFVQHVPAAVAMLDNNMHYIATSNSWLQDFNLQDRRVVGVSYYDLFDFLPAEARERHQRILRGAIEHNDEDTFLFAADHKQRYTAWEMRPWYQFDGSIGGIMIFTQDVTQRVEQREQLKAAKIQAEEASLAKSEFLANMSHEIRTPLNGVIGFTDLVLKTNLTDTQQQYLSIVNQSANALLSIINDILDFSKIEAGKLELEVEQVDLLEMSAQTTDLISYQVQDKGLEMLLNLKPDLPRFIWADVVRLKQILVNLLSNAIKFTEQGEIELKIEKLSGSDDQCLIRFSVRDTGIGIKPEKQQKIFEAFSQEDGSTTKKYGGTGLGLTISNKLLGMMNSRLELISAPDSGSTFFFDIHLKSVIGEPIRWESLDHIKNVMIVDDNDNNREIISQMLLLKNINTTPAKNGFEALQLLAEGRRFDVILMDYHMPYMDGLQTIAKIREHFYATKEEQAIILLSSSSDTEFVAKRSEVLQVNRRLLKPVKMQDIYNAISRLYQKAAPGVQPATEERTLTNNEYTILIAEDNAINMLLTVTILGRIVPNAKLIQTKNGLEALSYCLQSWPNLILMDVQMPEMNGLEATAKIRSLEAEGSHIPIIALTAANVKDEKDRCLASGMDDFILKPIAEETLVKVIDQWL